MTCRRKSVCILMAEDDPDDRMLAEDALREARLLNGLRFVEDLKTNLPHVSIDDNQLIRCR